MSSQELTETERVDLMRFLCSFAWADGEVQAEERAVLLRVAESLTLNPDKRDEVMSWLATPPDMEGFEFGAISADKRGVFLDLAFEIASAHGGLDPEELRHLSMFMNFEDPKDAP